jgi:hypothetical protein
VPSLPSLSKRDRYLVDVWLVDCIIILDVWDEPMISIDVIRMLKNCSITVYLF